MTDLEKEQFKTLPRLFDELSKISHQLSRIADEIERRDREEKEAVASLREVVHQELERQRKIEKPPATPLIRPDNLGRSPHR